MVRIKKLNKVGVSHHFLLPLIAILAVGGIGYYMLTMSNAATVPGDPTGVQAKRAYNFIDSQGVITHIDEDLYTNKTDVLAALRYLGMSNVRDNISRTSEVRTYLAQNNIKFHATLAPPKKADKPLFPARLDKTTASVNARVADLLNNPSSGSKYAQATVSQEPYNEYNNKENNWSEVIAKVQREMWEQSNARLKTVNQSIKVVGPSLIGYNVKDTTATLQTKNIGAYMDYGNIHSYYGGLAPETSLANNDGDNGFVVPTAELPRSSNTLEERLKLYSTRISGTKPIAVTEMGYHDYMPNPAGQHKPTDPRAISIYMPRAYLENFRIGIVRSYAYQMYDEAENSKEYEKHFGLFGTGKSANPKPSAQAMHFMNMRLIDSGATAKTFTAGKLDFRLTNAPSNLHYLLLQKSNGKFYLVMWKAESVYNNTTRQYTAPSAASNVSVTFGRNRSVTAFFPNEGSRFTSLGRNKTSFVFPVSARATVFEVQ